MRKKMKLPFTLKSTDNAAAPWLWPTCVNNPRTLSFRSRADENSFKIINKTDDVELIDTPDSFFSATASFNSEFSITDRQYPNITDDEESAAKAVIQGLKSNSRLFFKPGETSSILEEAKTHVPPRAKSVRILAVDSRDPLTDFRTSMEEMVEANGLRDWACLDELLACYLRVNRRSNHGYIVRAFVDLLLNLHLHRRHVTDNRCSSSSTATRCSSTCSSLSPCLSSLETED